MLVTPLSPSQTPGRGKSQLEEQARGYELVLGARESDGCRSGTGANSALDLEGVILES